MSVINKFDGMWGERMEWEGARVRHYDGDAAAAVRENWLIGKAEAARNFAIRYYEVGVDGRTKQEEHEHDHGIVVLHGQGRVLLDNDWNEIAQGDVIYISPNERHQLVNTGAEPLGFLCVITAVRKKNGKDVWAEEKVTSNSEQSTINN
jgi:quercetin dioxygenase-like cupin family protein